MLTNKEYLTLENYIIERFDHKMLIGHCSREAAIRQAISDGMEKFGLVEPWGRGVIMNPNALIKITEFVD